MVAAPISLTPVVAQCPIGPCTNTAESKTLFHHGSS
jgi:hypothetical protein